MILTTTHDKLALYLATDTQQCKGSCSHPSGVFSTLNSQQQPMLQPRPCTIVTLLADSNCGGWQAHGSWHSHKTNKKSPQQDPHLPYFSETNKAVSNHHKLVYGETGRKEQHCIFHNASLIEDRKERLSFFGASTNLPSPLEQP